jgi:hypothetical protein
MAGRSSFPLLVALLLAVPGRALPHVIPDDVSLQIFAKPDGERLHMLVRLPFNALADIIFPTGAGGELDLPRTEVMLPDAAKLWISDWVDVYENGRLLAKPRLIETRISLASDNSFVSYEEAWAHVTGPRLPGNVQIYANQALLDVLFDYSIQSNQSNFAIHSRLSRLGGKVASALQFLPPGGRVRAYSYQGDPGLFSLDPSWPEAIQRFVPLGFFAILKGTDYLLFLFCIALLFRRWTALLPFLVAFIVGHSLTLIAAAYNLAPDALWFPVLFETLIAMSVLYLALENVVEATPAQYRAMAACGFGLIYGFGFSFALRQTLQFGGSHVLASVLSFHAGIELGHLLVLALLLPLLNLLFRIGVPERIGTIFLAALAAHTGWHQMLDRARWLTSVPFQWPAFDPVLVAGVLRWSVISLILGGTLYFVFRVLRPRPSAKLVR